MFFNNKQNQKPLRKSLRYRATPQEVIVWSRLRNSQLGYKFRRQQSLGNYIVDFYCPKKKLAIEIDGAQHIDNEPDQARTRFLNNQNIQVLRFWNNEVNTNIEGVLFKIITTLEKVETLPPPNPSLERRGGRKELLQALQK